MMLFMTRPMPCLTRSIQRHLSVTLFAVLLVLLSQCSLTYCAAIRNKIKSQQLELKPDPESVPVDDTKHLKLEPDAEKVLIDNSKQLQPHVNKDIPKHSPSLGFKPNAEHVLLERSEQLEFKPNAENVINKKETRLKLDADTVLVRDSKLGQDSKGQRSNLMGEIREDLKQLNDDVSNEKESLKDVSKPEVKGQIDGNKVKEDIETDSKFKIPNRDKFEIVKLKEKLDKIRREKDMLNYDRNSDQLRDRIELVPNRDVMEGANGRPGNVNPANRGNLRPDVKQRNKANWNNDGTAHLKTKDSEADSSILRFGIAIDQPIEHRPLPVVKAPNKIDAIVKVRQSVENQRFMQAKFELGIDEIQPQDHLDGVRMEQDGHLNRDYKKEIFLGNHEEIDNLTDEEAKKRLMQIFRLVDHNKNRYITVDELEDWIITKVQEHFREASLENKHVFEVLDSDEDNMITWPEFHKQFLIGLGFNEKSAEFHAVNAVEDEDEDEGGAALMLDSEDKERLIRFRLKWSEADTDLDNMLNLDEFQAFRHPEQSRAMLTNMVDDIMDNLDKNRNGVVSEQEFVALPPAGVGHELHEADRQWQAERRKEFRNVIDINHDGKLTKQELLNYVDPQNPNHAKLEARNLLELGDSNRDERLSLQEVLDNADLFMGSKMVDTGASFHDEF